jgi:hypothetical protein
MKFDFWMCVAGAGYAIYLVFMLWLAWRDFSAFL